MFLVEKIPPTRYSAGMDFELIQADANRIEEIMHIESKCFDSGIQEKRSVFLERLDKTAGTFFLFAEKESGKIAGYLSAEHIERIPQAPEEIALNHMPSQASTGTVYISSFAILPEYHGKGIGKKLWNDSLAELKKRTSARTFVLIVNENWKSARHIYEASGFTEAAVFKMFFQDGDGILMTRS